MLELELQLLLSGFLLNVEAERASVLLAVLGMVAAEGGKLFADGASTIGLPFAAFGVIHGPLLLAGRQGTVGIAAMAGMHQRLCATLGAQAFLWVFTFKSPSPYSSFVKAEIRL